MIYLLVVYSENDKFLISLLVVHSANDKFLISLLVVHSANDKFLISLLVVHSANDKFFISLLVVHSANDKQQKVSGLLVSTDQKLPTSQRTALLHIKCLSHFLDSQNIKMEAE